MEGTVDIRCHKVEQSGVPATIATGDGRSSQSTEKLGTVECITHRLSEKGK